MIALIIVLLIILWFLGYVQIPGILIPDTTLFTINGHPVTLVNLFILLLILWAIGILPSPLREVAGLFLILWLLSLFGIIAVIGLSSILIWVIIIGLIFVLVS